MDKIRKEAECIHTWKGDDKKLLMDLAFWNDLLLKLPNRWNWRIMFDLKGRLTVPKVLGVNNGDV